MRSVLCLIALLAASLPVHAALFKCTADDGSVAFRDTPCRDQNQEILKDSSYASPQPSTKTGGGDSSLDRPSTAATPASNDMEGLFTLERIKALEGGKKSSASSPLGKAYMRFLRAMQRCDRASVIKVVSRKTQQKLNAAFDEDAAQARKECKMLSTLLPGNLNDATEVIDGNRGKIQWLTVATNTDGSTTSTMKSETTQDFVKEDGVWRFDN